MLTFNRCWPTVMEMSACYSSCKVSVIRRRDKGAHGTHWRDFSAFDVRCWSTLRMKITSGVPSALLMLVALATAIFPATRDGIHWQWASLKNNTDSYTYRNHPVQRTATGRGRTLVRPFLFFERPNRNELATEGDFTVSS